MYVDFKITCWERVSIPEERKEEIIEKIKNGTISTANDLFEEYEDEVHLEGVIAETEEYMIPEENDGQATIEIGEKGEETFFTNAKF